MTARRCGAPIPNPQPFSRLKLLGMEGLIGRGAAGSCRLISLMASAESERTSAGSHQLQLRFTAGEEGGSAATGGRWVLFLLGVQKEL